MDSRRGSYPIISGYKRQGLHPYLKLLLGPALNSSIGNKSGVGDIEAKLILFLIREVYQIPLVPYHLLLNKA